MDEKEETLLLEICDSNIERCNKALHEALNTDYIYILKAIKRILMQRGITRNLEDMANDIFQGVVTDMLCKAQSGDLLNINSLTGYIFNAARCHTLAYLKKEGRLTQKMRDIASTFWTETDQMLVEFGTNPLETEELEKVIYECMEKLPGKQKDYIKILAQHYDAPPEPKDIAQMFGISSESVRNRLVEARKNMEECLKSKGYYIPISK